MSNFGKLVSDIYERQKRKIVRNVCNDFNLYVLRTTGGDIMKCNYKPPKLTKEEQQKMASLKSTLPYIDRLQIEQRGQEIDYREYDKKEKIILDKIPKMK